MTTRTKRSMAYFEAPFALRGLDGIRPVGDDDINEDENIIEGLSLASLPASRLSSTSGQEFQPPKRSFSRSPTPNARRQLEDQETITCTSTGVIKPLKHLHTVL